MAGVTDEVSLEDAMGIASFLIAMGRVPPPAVWVESLVMRARDGINEGALESLF